LNKSEQEELRNRSKVLFEVVPPLFEVDTEDRHVPMDAVAEQKDLLKVSFVRHPLER
jgi:hypothetical protein